MTISINERYPGHRQQNVYDQWIRYNDTYDRAEQSKKVVVPTSAPVAYWAQRPVGQSEQTVLRRVPSNVNPSVVTIRSTGHGNAVSIPVQPVRAVFAPLNEASMAFADETLLMFMANDRYCAQRMFHQLYSETTMLETESMINAAQHKAAQRIIDNMGTDIIQRDKNGKIIAREQWVLESNGRTFRQVVFRA